MMEEGGAAERAKEREMWNGLHVCGDWEGEVLIVGKDVDCDRLVVIRRISSR